MSKQVVVKTQLSSDREVRVLVNFETPSALADYVQNLDRRFGKQNVEIEEVNAILYIK